MNYFLLILSVFLSLSCWNNRKEDEIKKIEVKNNRFSDTTIFNYDSVITETKNLLTDDFIIQPFSCFVIISNLQESETDKIIYNTIAPAANCFYNDFFQKRPDELIKVFLFKDEKSYRYWARKLFDDDDVSYFGYYKPSQKTMLMNISTGTGTLVHELTHAFVRYDFPDIPAWFNEGLGSLYERCSLNNGEIIGYVNWRLPSLQNAIKNKTYTELDILFDTDDDEFYGEKSGFYYAQARYFCLYMQEKNLLKKFYKLLRDNFEEDKTGKSFVVKMFEKDLKSIEKEFKSWASKLTLKN
ncbi:MAG: hypothetical protein FJ216_00640 [Ignavibacteria bacterium]|nr:hypothetical protein [Ignavibacteria bacterium]